MAANKGKRQVSDDSPRIEYSGFKDFEKVEMVQVQSAAEAFVEKVVGHGLGITRLSVRLKSIHKVGNNQKFEVHVELNARKGTRAAGETDKNIFKALDLSFKKLMYEVTKNR